MRDAQVVLAALILGLVYFALVVALHLGVIAALIVAGIVILALLAVARR